MINNTIDPGRQLDVLKYIARATSNEITEYKVRLMEKLDELSELENDIYALKTSLEDHEVKRMLIRKQIISLCPSEMTKEEREERRKAAALKLESLASWGLV